MARMAWFRKERKPRTSERVRLEIPPDAWEKCDECGHMDLKDRFIRALNVCPNCGHHRRIGAQDYIDLLVDDGSWHELNARLRSADPLTFESYRDRLDNLTLTRKGVADTSPAYEIFNRFLKRLGQRVDYVDAMLKTNKFDFTADERMVANRRESPYPKDLAEARELWRQRLRFEYLLEKLARMEPKKNAAVSRAIRGRSSSRTRQAPRRKSPAATTQPPTHQGADRKPSEM